MPRYRRHASLRIRYVQDALAAAGGFPLWTPARPAESQRARPATNLPRRGRRGAPNFAQVQHLRAAQRDPPLREATNHGNPPIAAATRPGELKEAALPASGATPLPGVHAPADLHPASTTETQPPNANEQHPTGGYNPVTAHPETHPLTRPTTPAHLERFTARRLRCPT